MFTPLVHEVEVVTTTLPWPQPIASYKVATEDVSCYVIADSVFRLKCGRTDCDYELIPYQFLPSTTEIRGHNNDGAQLETSVEEFPGAQQNADLYSSCLNAITMTTTTYDNNIAQNSPRDIAIRK